MGKMCVLVVIVVAIELCTFLNAQVHTHSHDVEQEPAHYKYSREANEAAAWERDHHQHDHLYEAYDSVDKSAHQHGHSHDHHGHSHDDTHHADHGNHYMHTHGFYDQHAHSHGGKYAPDARDSQHGHSHGSGGCPYAHSHGQHHTEHDHAHGHSHIERSNEKSSEDSLNDQHLYSPTSYLWFMNNAYTRLWVHSIGSTLIISIAPFVLLSVIPVQANTAENEPLLKVLLSFGSGGLLGDAFLHLIPHAQPARDEAHSHSHSHSHGSGHSHGPHDMSVGGYVLAGIIAFLTVEKLVRIFRSKEGGHGHSHSHSQLKKDETKLKKDDKDKRSDISSTESSCDESDKKRLMKEKPQQTGFKVAAYLNMAADFTHNFTDGLAIGASYLAGSTIGLVTTITVLVHEVPHEIGDFAILVQSGFSKKRAMCVQLLTAVGALSGCVLSLLTADAQNLADAASSSWILPFTAGGFIYIATVSVIPELLENSSPYQSIKEIIALLTGIGLMYLIAAYE